MSPEHLFTKGTVMHFEFLFTELAKERKTRLDREAAAAALARAADGNHGHPWRRRRGRRPHPRTP